MPTIEVRKTKNIGLGSLSFALCLIGIVFTFQFGDKPFIGDHILNTIGLSFLLNGGSGIHYTMFYSTIFFIPSFIIGHIHPDNRGAKAGNIISGFLSILIVSVLLTIIIDFL
ncbi:hypothetical protein J7J00_22745 [Bacillus sp. ISL-4]|uniref:hypothetical protein n=1 Tax=Bacillus sp. ISL-4 TaxID=2819125 RepID=UPI001BEB4CB8|nr:hypothetical protein [Bacillus sp. ISL-4]MBT2668263.1 hypothetical protein [Bacillus sp. ISL-4]MBT2671812.1 hypothetical protein [Streptomyces sp. ISL-14]